LTEEPSFRDLLKEIKSAVEDKEVKKIKLPWKGRIGRFKVKRGWASIMYVHNNRSVEFLRAPIEDNTVRVGDLYHTATPDDILIFRGKPMLLIPEWGIKPLQIWKASEHYKDTEEKGDLTQPQRHILSKLEHGIIKAKTKIAMGGWIMLGVAGLAVLYFFSQGGFS